MSHNVTLKGEFVNLRPLVVEDAEITLQWRLSERAKLLNKGAENLEQQKRWIASRPDDEYNFVIELKNGKPVGMLSIAHIEKTHRRCEPTRFLIGDEESSQGLPVAVEAMKLLYGFIFDTLKLRRIGGTVVQDYPLMAKWQKYLGMKQEGILREHYYINGHFQDAIVLGLLEEEYRKISLPRMNALIAMARLQQKT
jgi:diamine N-acetyltransferase